MVEVQPPGRARCPVRLLRGWSTPRSWCTVPSQYRTTPCAFGQRVVTYTSVTDMAVSQEVRLVRSSTYIERAARWPRLEQRHRRGGRSRCSTGLHNRKLAVEPEQVVFAALCDRWDNLYYPQALHRGWGRPLGRRPARQPEPRPGARHRQRLPALRGHPGRAAVVPAHREHGPDPAGPTKARAIAGPGRAAVHRVEGPRAARDLSPPGLCGQGPVRAHRRQGLRGTTTRSVPESRGRRPAAQPVSGLASIATTTASTGRCYSYLITPDHALEDWGVCVERRLRQDGKPYPYVVHPALRPSTASTQILAGQQLDPVADLRVEVYDYWYRKPRDEARYRIRQADQVRDVERHLRGQRAGQEQDAPRVPGQAAVRPTVQHVRPGHARRASATSTTSSSSCARRTSACRENAQMIHRAIVGPDVAVDRGRSAQPGACRICSPSPTTSSPPAPATGSRASSRGCPSSRSSSTWPASTANSSTRGLNDLLRGMAPAQVLSSGKAIAALVANYETRITHEA